MCQKESKEVGAEPARSQVEDNLFRFALKSLDVIYAHTGLASMLSTRLPPGMSIGRGYNDRGWCAARRLARLRNVRVQSRAPQPCCVHTAAAGPTLSAQWVS